jgi:hypothetical protein
MIDIASNRVEMRSYFGWFSTCSYNLKVVAKLAISLVIVAKRHKQIHKVNVIIVIITFGHISYNCKAVTA